MKSLLSLAETVGLGVIFLATVISIGTEIWHMVELQRVDLADLLLLFLFMEVLAMIGIFHESHQIPVRFPIYIAIVALSRYLILESKGMEPWAMLAVGSTILILAVAVLAIRFGHVKFPYSDKEG
jgi:protein PsiE